MDLTEKRRVHEIARDEGLPSSLVLQRLQREGLPVKTASSTVIVGEALHVLNPKRYPRPESMDATIAAAKEAKEKPKKAAKDEEKPKPKPRARRKPKPAPEPEPEAAPAETPAADTPAAPVEAEAPAPEVPTAEETTPEATEPEVEATPAAPVEETPAAAEPVTPEETTETAEQPEAATPEAVTPETPAAPEEPALAETAPETVAAEAESAPVEEAPAPADTETETEPAVPAEGEDAEPAATAEGDAPVDDAAGPAAKGGRRKVVPPTPPPPRPPLRRAEPPAPRPPLRRAADEPQRAPGTGPATGTGTGGAGGIRDPRRPGERDIPGRPGPGGRRRRVVIDAQAGRRGPGGPQGRDRRGGRKNKQEEREPAVTIPPSEMPPVDIRSGATIKEISEALGVPATRIITTLMAIGEMATITQSLSDDEIELVASELERKVVIVHAEEEDEFAFEEEDPPGSVVARAPVVTVMGHVDHGKTSLLDAIRETEVVAGEAGGITQHIGAYQVHHNDRLITFLDTPGHEAFTAMRARGAKITDVAVIVVAADDGVMPTTLEAIDHAKAAEVPFMIAINKIDKPDANPDRVRQELSQHEIIPTSWGGTYEFIEVSAKARQGLDSLLDTVLLIADVDATPQANPDAPASGSVIESRLDAGRGPVCTLLVQRGTLNVGDVLLVGQTFGRVRAMHDYNAESIETAGPSVPAEILGMGGVPEAGDRFRAVENERVARQLAAQRSHRIRAQELANRRPVSLEDLFARVQEGLNELNIIIKADVHGSVEALRDALEGLEQTEVRLRVIHTGVGAVTESDINLAAASEAIVIAFNVRPRPEARALAEREGVDLRSYRIIYRAIEDVRDALIGMLSPEIVESQLGSLEVRETFRASRIGTIAGCYVTEGLIRRNANMRLVRDGTVVFEGKVGSLRRFDDDAREVTQGFECGVVIEGYNDVKEGDTIEVYELTEVARTEQAPAADSVESSSSPST